jgi:hypothetical protein
MQSREDRWSEVGSGLIEEAGVGPWRSGDGG